MIICSTYLIPLHNLLCILKGYFCFPYASCNFHNYHFYLFLSYQSLLLYCFPYIIVVHWMYNYLHRIQSKSIHDKIYRKICFFFHITNTIYQICSLFFMNKVEYGHQHLTKRCLSSCICSHYDIYFFVSEIRTFF